MINLLPPRHPEEELTEEAFKLKNDILKFYRLSMPHITSNISFFELLTTVPMMPCLSQLYTYLVNRYPSSDNANSNDL